MKRFVIILILVCLAAVAVMGQDVSLQMALATQALNQNMLSELGVPQSDIDEILALQTRFRLRKEERNLELNVLKARIAQELYAADANTAEVNSLLEQAGELRLMQEKEQVEAYIRIRMQLGEKNWSELMERVRIQARNRVQVQNENRNDSSGDSSGSSRSSSGSSSNGSSSGQSSGSSSSRGRSGN